MTNDLKLKIYPAVIAILGLSLAALLLSRLEIQVSQDSTGDYIPPAAKPIEPSPQLAPPSPIPTPSPTPAIVEAPATPSPTPSIAANVPAIPAGGLRVSNQTSMPVRVALLYQSDAATQSDLFQQAVHWDFAPEEGGAKGLILSLPDNNLRLIDGDVLVAFAQDGSRRYWGPYVVGKTPLPTWSKNQQEWVLVLQP